MSEYIKREDAIKAFEQWKEPQVLNEQDDVWNRGIDCCINEVKHHVPSADVVEVVRCRDCIHCHKISITAQPVSIRGTMRCNLRGGVVKGNDYCSCGEHEDGERTIFIDETVDETCGYGEDGESE